MTQLTFFGGVNEIGGNKIMLQDKDTKVFLDFGMSFNDVNKYFSEFMQPRKCNGLGDFIEFGLIPDLPGLYRQDYLKHMGRNAEDLEFQGLLLSHAHADHSSYISHLRDDLPIYCSTESYHILKAVNDTSRTSFNELIDCSKSFETYINRNGEVNRKTSRTHPDIVVDRPFKPFNHGEKIRIDDLEIVPYKVDHSLSGATGYIIYTSSGVVVYTGDFRFHGRREAETNRFMQACEDAEPDVLLIEGTRVNEENAKTETWVEDEISTVASKSRGLSVCNWSVRDTDRMLSFLNAAKKLNKKLTISLKQAYLLAELSKCEDSLAPDLNDPSIRIYANRKSWGLIGSGCCERLLNGDYESWEQNFIDKAICYKDVKDSQDQYLFYCSNYDLKELIDIRPDPGSVYIKSVCEPFDLEMEMEWERISNWINHFGLEVSQTHVSGHASGPQLKVFIEKVSPKLIIPIHTENPEVYEKWGKTQLIEKVGYSHQF